MRAIQPSALPDTKAASNRAATGASNAASTAQHGFIVTAASRVSSAGMPATSGFAWSDGTATITRSNSRVSGSSDSTPVRVADVERPREGVGDRAHAGQPDVAIDAGRHLFPAFTVEADDARRPFGGEAIALPLFDRGGEPGIPGGEVLRAVIEDQVGRAARLLDVAHDSRRHAPAGNGGFFEDDDLMSRINQRARCGQSGNPRTDHRDAAHRPDKTRPRLSL